MVEEEHEEEDGEEGATCLEATVVHVVTAVAESTEPEAGHF